MQRIIFHIDINSYFATMLQQENPALRGKAIGVIKDVGRSCIIASSNEAKKVGVKTGCTVKEAKKIAPQIILVPVQFDIMLSATRKLKDLFGTFSPSVHIFSLDEVFLDLTGCENLMRSTKEAYAKEIQDCIREVLGEWIQCNVGISHNKLLAKMAGEIGPKGSVSTIDASNLDAVLTNITFKDVCGVGSRLEKKLALLGVMHPMQINVLDDETLYHHFGPHWSKELRKVGRGEETHFFTHERTVSYQQSVGRTITGYRLCDDEAQIRRILLNLLEEATHKLRAMDLSGRKIGVSLSGGSGQDAFWSSHRTLRYWVRHTDEIWNLLYHGMYGRWQRTFPIIKFGVWIGDCRPTRVVPQSFFPEWERREKIYGIVDAINDKFGSFTLMPATLLGGPVIRPEVTGYLGDKIYLGL